MERETIRKVEREKKDDLILEKKERKIQREQLTKRKGKVMRAEEGDKENERQKYIKREREREREREKEKKREAKK